MAKKSKRRTRSRVPAVSRPAPVRAEVRTAPVSPEQATVQRTVDFASEYRYVYSDLRRIGILALSMFALLVALALLARYVL